MTPAERRAIEQLESNGELDAAADAIAPFLPRLAAAFRGQSIKQKRKPNPDTEDEAKKRLEWLRHYHTETDPTSPRDDRIQATRDHFGKIFEAVARVVNRKDRGVESLLKKSPALLESVKPF